MTTDLERRLREIAEHKYMSVTLGHPRAMALAKACLDYRAVIELNLDKPHYSLETIDAELLKALGEESGQP